MRVQSAATDREIPKYEKIQGSQTINNVEQINSVLVTRKGVDAFFSVSGTDKAKSNLISTGKSLRLDFQGRTTANNEDGSRDYNFQIQVGDASIASLIVSQKIMDEAKKNNEAQLKELQKLKEKGGDKRKIELNRMHNSGSHNLGYARKAASAFMESARNNRIYRIDAEEEIDRSRSSSRSSLNSIDQSAEKRSRRRSVSRNSFSGVRSRSGSNSSIGSNSSLLGHEPQNTVYTPYGPVGALHDERRENPPPPLETIPGTPSTAPLSSQEGSQSPAAFGGYGGARPKGQAYIHNTLRAQRKIAYTNPFNSESSDAKKIKNTQKLKVDILTPARRAEGKASQEDWRITQQKKSGGSNSSNYITAATSTNPSGEPRKYHLYSGDSSDTSTPYVTPKEEKKVVKKSLFSRLKDIFSSTKPKATTNKQKDKDAAQTEENATSKNNLFSNPKPEQNQNQPESVNTERLILSRKKRKDHTQTPNR